jgi:hypothetical protein
MTVQLSVPHTGDTPKTITADISKLPENVRSRLIEIALQGRIRSGVNNAVNLEIDKAVDTAQKAHDAAQKAEKAKDKNYKATKFDEKAFRAAFTSKVDPMATAAAVLSEMEAGKIRVRGTSQSDKLLTTTIRNNIVAVLVSKGKKQRDAKAMVGDDPMDFLEKTARKRAGDGEGSDEVFTTELAKLHAQYVEPARALLAPDEPEDADEGEEAPEAGSAADDLV